MRYILIILLFASCSPTKRLRRLIDKNPELARVDTIYDVDSFVIAKVKHDTVMRIVRNDTVVIREGRLEVRYYYDTRTDTLRLEGTCDADTIIQKEIHTTEKIIYTARKKRGSFIWDIINGRNYWGIITLAIILLIMRRKKRGPS